MSRSDWLSRYVADPETGRWYCEVVACDGRLVATDGKSMVAVRGGGVQDECRVVGSVVARMQIRPFLTTQPLAAIRTTLGALWAFCGCVRWDWCDSCGGRGSQGTYEEDFDGGGIPCPDCDGGRWLPATADAGHCGKVVGVQCDLSRLAWSLAPELGGPGDEVTVGRMSVGDDKPIVVVDGDGWRVLVMGMLEDFPLHRGNVYPSFHADPLFAQLWLGREDACTRLALADWLTERGDGYAARLRVGTWRQGG